MGHHARVFTVQFVVHREGMQVVRIVERLPKLRGVVAVWIWAMDGGVVL